MAELNQQQVIDYIKGISVLELSQLVKALESELGVSAAAAMPMAMPGAAAGGGAAAAAVEEKTEFNVTLTETGTRQDQGHQGGPRGHEPRAQGSQGPGRERAQADQGSRAEGRGRSHQEEVRRSRREGLDLVRRGCLRKFLRRARVGRPAYAACSTSGPEGISHRCTAFPRISTASARTFRRSRPPSPSRTSSKSSGSRTSGSSR